MKILCKLLAGLMISTVANAGFMAEPWLGYESGTLKCTQVVGNSDCGGKFTGLNYGLRLGWMLPVGMWVAAEYNGGSGTAKYDDSGTADNDFDRTIIGAALGYDFPMGLRLFGGYGFSNTLKDKVSTGDITFKGTAYHVGVGYKIQNRFSVNLEYHVDSYTKFDAPSANLTDTEVSTVWSTLDFTRLMLTVSYIFGGGK